MHTSFCQPSQNFTAVPPMASVTNNSINWPKAPFSPRPRSVEVISPRTGRPMTLNFDTSPFHQAGTKSHLGAIFPSTELLLAPHKYLSAAALKKPQEQEQDERKDWHINSTNQQFDPLMERLFGPLIAAAFNEPLVTEIMLNENGQVFVEHQELGMFAIGKMEAQPAQNALRTLSTLMGQDINPFCPIISGDLTPQNARFEGLLPPLVSNPVFAIRRHQEKIRSLQDLVSLGSLTPDQGLILSEFMKTPSSILISGATGSGKTSLVDTLLDQLYQQKPQERVITIEDTKELAIRKGNYVHLVGNGKVELSTLVRSALRLRPDRIVVGEVRGPEALDLVDALTTGHSGGIATIHAGTPQQALKRLCLLVSRHPNCPRNIESLVGDAFHLVVQVERIGQSRKVTAMSLCRGFNHDHFELVPLTLDNLNLHS